MDDQLRASFVIALRAGGRSELTVKSYLLGVDAYRRWCAGHGRPEALDRAQVREWLVALQDEGAARATVASKLAGVRALSKWMAEEGLQDADPLLRLAAPKPDMPTVPVLAEDQLRALFGSCGKDFRGRRDEALLRLMAETGLRVAEALALDVADVDMTRGLGYVRRGKGGKGRIVPFSAKTAQALDRYLRARRLHPAAGLDALFLTALMARRLADHGLRRTLKARALSAGIDGFHPHVLRHTAASRWLAAGGSEGGLMSVAGWSSRDMLDRYARATASERAAAEARGLGLGDL